MKRPIKFHLEMKSESFHALHSHKTFRFSPNSMGNNKAKIMKAAGTKQTHKTNINKTFLKQQQPRSEKLFAIYSIWDRFTVI